MYKILIVDDEQLTRTFLKNIIPTLDSGWQVSGEASDGMEACAFLAEESVDLVITDIKMPIMDGVALCEYIHNNFPSLITVILSGYGEFEYAQKAIIYGVSNYLLKPIVNEELKKMLGDIENGLNIKKKTDYEQLKLIQLSSRYKSEIAVNLLQAIVSQSHVQIKSLLPLLYHLDISLMEEEGVILLIQPLPISDEALQKNVNTGLTKLLIYQTSLLAVEKTNNRVLLDTEGNTLIYMPLTEETDYKKRIFQVHNKLNSLLNDTSIIEFSTCVGSVESDLLQLGSSFEHSKTAFLQMLFSEIKSPVVFYTEGLYNNQIIQLHEMISVLGLALSTRNAVMTTLLKANLDAFSQKNVIAHMRDCLTCFIIKSLCRQLALDNINISDQKGLILGIDLIEKALKVPDSDENLENELVSKAKSYIFRHYHEPISLSLIADELSVSPSYLSNLFHESVGKSYVKYLTDIRMKQAGILLRQNKSMTLEEITKKVGYISVKHFSFVFKKYYNMTTSDYRR